MTDGRPHHIIARRLETVAAALAAQDAEGAVDAVDKLVAACEATRRGSLNREALAEILPLLTRCQETATRARDAAAASLLHLGESQRARNAYRER